MSSIRNRLIIVHDYDFDRIRELRENAVRYFEQVVSNEENDTYDVDSKMISPILSSFVNEEYTFVIMGDCSKSGWELSENFEKLRQEWIKQNRGACQNILVADFGDDGAGACVEDFSKDSQSELELTIGQALFCCTNAEDMI